MAKSVSLEFINYVIVLSRILGCSNDKSSMYEQINEITFPYAVQCVQDRLYRFFYKKNHANCNT